jgi:hypothetical protein
LLRKDSYIEVTEKVEAAAPQATAPAINTAGTATQKKKKKKKSTQGHSSTSAPKGQKSGKSGKNKLSKPKSTQNGTAQPSPTYRPVYSTLAPKDQRVDSGGGGDEVCGGFEEEAEGLYLEPGVNAF